MQIPGMIEMRVDMIVVACCLIKFILSNFLSLNGQSVILFAKRGSVGFVDEAVINEKPSLQILSPGL